MLEVVFLEFPVIKRESISHISTPRVCGSKAENLRFVMQEVVGKVVAHISEYTAEKHICRNIPIKPEDEVRQIPKRYYEAEEQRRRHYEPELIHRYKMMNSMKQEMQRYRQATIRHYSIAHKN